MNRFFLPLILGLFMALGPQVAVADDYSEADIKRLALEAILENPEILTQAIAILQQRDQDAQNSSAEIALNDNRDALERDPNAPVLGNPDGDVTIVEFFDYNCPYCNRVATNVKSLIEADGNIRLVYREWPILSEGSIYAARAALASQKQGKYAAFHWTLMSLPRADENSVQFAAKKLGLDVDMLLADMNSPEIDAHIERSSELSSALGFNGTPSFVIGNELIGGAISLEQLQEYVKAVREE
jgi:protein-disulfide isomerase